MNPVARFTGEDKENKALSSLTKRGMWLAEGQTEGANLARLLPNMAVT